MARKMPSVEEPFLTLDRNMAIMLGLAVLLCLMFVVNVCMVVFVLFARRQKSAADADTAVHPRDGAQREAQVVVAPETVQVASAPEPESSRKVTTSTTVVSTEPKKATPKPSPQALAKMTPHDVLAAMKAGNARFWTGASERPDMPLVERSELLAGQSPKVMVIGCADSRVPIVFDQGLGDVFVCRNAGNLHDDYIAGTIDYAVHVLGVKLIVVMGHQGCGAVKAALAKPAVQAPGAPKPAGLPPKLSKMLGDIRNGLEHCVDVLDRVEDAGAKDRESVIANAQVQVKKVLAETGIKAKADKKEILVLPAIYNISSGIVDFIEPATAAKH